MTEQAYTKEDVGTVIEKRVTPNGTYYNEQIVHVFCQHCAAEFIGPAREAGGFLGGHECLHAWEFARMLGEDSGMTA